MPASVAETVCAFVKSTSVTAKLFDTVKLLLFSPPARSVISVTPPANVPAPITGASFVPVMVTTTFCVQLLLAAPLLSATVTV